jgi:hypothetical protein
MRCVAESREEKEKKLERECRAKQALKDNPDACRKRKWPRCRLISLGASMMLCSNELLTLL